MHKAFLLLLASGFTAFAQTVTNLPFTWNPSVTQPAGAAFGYRFYEKLAGGARILLGGSTGTNVFFTVTNFVLGSSRTFAVTATNLTGESSESPAYVAPLIEPAPGNLRPVSFFLTSPVPGVVELSQDLTNWTDRIRVRSASASSADIELVQAPRYPILFGRVKTNSPSLRSALPLPR